MQTHYVNLLGTNTSAILVTFLKSNKILQIQLKAPALLCISPFSLFPCCVLRDTSSSSELAMYLSIMIIHV